MSEIKDGGAAFPIPNDDRTGAYPAEPGMSLRDWFAGQALAQVMDQCRNDHRREGESLRRMFARRAYELADAMLAARKG